MTASRSMPPTADLEGAPRLHLLEPGGDLAALAGIIEHAAHLLPQQGPITVFIHHNTLHALEDLPFDEALRKGAQVFGCQPYLGEDRYRDELTRGRIRFSELHEVVESDLGERAREPVPGFGTRLDLRMAMLQYPLLFGPTEELVWYVAERDALRRVRPEASSAMRARLIAETRRWAMRDLRGGREGQSNGSARRAGDPPSRAGVAELLDRYDESVIEAWGDGDWERFTLQALWRVCCDGVRDLPPFSPRPTLPLRHRDLLLEATGEDADALVHGVLIRFCAAFLDQGLAAWPLPNRDEGFWRAFGALHGRDGVPTARWRAGLSAELIRLHDHGVGPLESIRESLDELGVERSEWEPFLSATLLALRGWAGMVRQIEERGDRVVRPVPRGSLVEFLAVRLLLDRFALAYTAREALGYKGPLAGLRDAIPARPPAAWPPSVEQRAFLVFQLAQVVGLSPDQLDRLARPEWAAVLEEIETFGGLERRRVFHLAYERRFYTQALDAIAMHSARPSKPPATPRFQVITCIDEREESFRRHLEELAPDCRDLRHGRVLLGRDVLPRGVRRAFRPLCPAVMRPQALGRRAGARRASGGRPTAGADASDVGDRLASHPHRQPVGDPGRTAGGAGGRGDGPAGRPHPLPAADGPAPPLGPPDRARAAADPAPARADRIRTRPGRRRRRVLTGRDDGDRREGPARDRPDGPVFPAGGRPGPRLDEHEQPARVGARLRGLRRRAGRRERAGPGADPQRPAGPRAAHCARSDDPGRDPLRRRLAQHQQRAGDVLRPRPDPGRPSRGVLRLPVGHRADLRAECPRALPSVPLGAPDALDGGRTAARRGPRRGPGAGPPRVGPRDQRDHDRRPPRLEPRPVPRPSRVPRLVRPDPGRRRGLNPHADPLGRLPGLLGHQPRVLFLVRRQHRLGLRDEAAAQHHVARRGDGRLHERPAHGAAVADGRDPRAGALALRDRDDGRGDEPDHGTSRGRPAALRPMAGSRWR